MFYVHLVLTSFFSPLFFGLDFTSFNLWTRCSSLFSFVSSADPTSEVARHPPAPGETPLRAAEPAARRGPRAGELGEARGTSAAFLGEVLCSSYLERRTCLPKKMCIFQKRALFSTSVVLILVIFPPSDATFKARNRGRDTRGFQPFDDVWC